MNQVVKEQYLAQRRIKHDGKYYQSGDPVWMTSGEAAPLLNRHAVRPMEGEDDPVTGAASGDEQPGDKAAKIVAAIGNLSEGDFIAAGSPKTSALSEAAGFDVSGDERDRAWAIVEAVREAPEGLDLTLAISASGIADVSEAEFTAALALRPKGEAS